MHGFFQIFTVSLVIQISLILTATALLGFVARRFLDRLGNHHATPDWLKTFSETLYTPSAWLIWVYGTLIAIEILINGANITFPIYILSKFRNLFFVIVTTWVLLKWKNKYEKILKTKLSNRTSKKNDEALIYAIGRVSSIFIIMVGGMIVFDILGIQLTALLAFGGIGGVAIGWAAKDVIANIFGGLMIHINRPFSVGDWIMSPNKNFEGTVEEIGWYMTRIRTFARRPMFIPNSIILDAIIENPQLMYNRRIKETIGVRYEDSNKVKDIVKDIEKMLKKHPAIDLNQSLFVHFVSFGPSALEIEVYTFTKTTDWAEWREIQQDVFLKIINIVESHDAQIAYPTRTLQIEHDPLTPDRRFQIGTHQTDHPTPNIP